MSTGLDPYLFVIASGTVSGVALGAAESGPNPSVTPSAPQFPCLCLATALPFLLLLLALAEDAKLWVRPKHSHTSSHK